VAAASIAVVATAPGCAFTTVLYNNNFYRNGRCVPAMVAVVVMVMVLPIPAIAGGGAIRTTGNLVHLVFGQILQW
jgi:hypothetical protein